MHAVGFAGMTDALKAWIGFSIGIDVMLAFGYAGKPVALEAWIAPSLAWESVSTVTAHRPSQ